MNEIPRELQALALKHGTDKFSHGYCPHYETRFAGMRASPIRLLEIGVFHGASLKMWHEYFPNARIAGIDNQSEAKWYPDNDAIVVEVGDQADAAFLSACREKHGPFQIVIDDGSHRPSDVLASFGALWPSVLPAGWYVVEDLAVLFEPYPPPATQTILDLLFDRRRDILTGNQWDVKEVHLVGGPHNDGMVFIRKAPAAQA